MREYVAIAAEVRQLRGKSPRHGTWHFRRRLPVEEQLAGGAAAETLSAWSEETLQPLPSQRSDHHDFSSCSPSEAELHI